MAEVYTGPRFTTSFSGRQAVRHPWLLELIACGRRFHARGWAHANDGYLAVRQGHGMVIKTAGTGLGELGPMTFTEVVDHDPLEHAVVAIGPSEPSSETAMAWLILRHRPDVHAIVHVHAPAPPDPDDAAANTRAGLAVTPEETDYGTLRLAQDCLGALRSADTVWLRDHGYVSIGASVPEAEDRLLRVLAAQDPTLDLDALRAAGPQSEGWSRFLDARASGRDEEPAARPSGAEPR